MLKIIVNSTRMIKHWEKKIMRGAQILSISSQCLQQLWGSGTKITWLLADYNLFQTLKPEIKITRLLAEYSLFHTLKPQTETTGLLPEYNFFHTLKPQTAMLQTLFCFVHTFSRKENNKTQILKPLVQLVLKIPACSKIIWVKKNAVRVDTLNSLASCSAFSDEYLTFRWHSTWAIRWLKLQMYARHRQRVSSNLEHIKLQSNTGVHTTINEAFIYTYWQIWLKLFKKINNIYISIWINWMEDKQ